MTTLAILFASWPLKPSPIVFIESWISSASAGLGGGGGVVSAGAAVATVSTGGGGGGGGGWGAGSSPAQANSASDVAVTRAARMFDRIEVSS